MKRILGIIGIVCTIFLLVTLPAFAEGSSLTLNITGEQHLLGEQITVEVVGKALTDIAGADIGIIFDSSKLELMEKMIPITDAINIQNHHGDNISLKDEKNKTKIIFGLNKDGVLLNNDKILATLIFRAIDKGQAVIGFSPESKLIKETNNVGTLDYMHIQPQLPADLTISIIKRAKISGKITGSDAYDISGAEIKLFKDGVQQASTIVDSEGSYDFTGIEDGNYTMKATLAGYEAFTQDIAVTGGVDVVFDMILQRILADADRNGIIELEDLVFVARRFGLSVGDTGWNVDADITRDGTVNMLDFVNITRSIQ